MYGVTSIQVYTYFVRYPKDSLLIKAMVLLTPSTVSCLTNLHQVFFMWRVICACFHRSSSMGIVDYSVLDTVYTIVSWLMAYGCMMDMASGPAKVLETVSHVLPLCVRFLTTIPELLSSLLYYPGRFWPVSPFTQSIPSKF